MLSTQSKQYPDRRLIIITWILLLAYFVLLANITALLLIDGDVCAFAGVVILIPFATVLVVSQYRSTYFAHRKSTQTSITLFSLIGCLFLMGLISTSYRRISLGLPVAWISEALPLLSVAIVAFSVVWIQTKRVDHLDNQSRIKFSSRELIVCFIGLMVLALGIPYFLNSMPRNFGENVSVNQSPSIFPAQATEISYCRDNRGTFAGEFTIDETGFRKWVNSGIGSLESQAAKVPIESISKPVKIRRYPSLSEKLQGEEQITLSEGLQYLWHFEDQNVQAVFDQTKDRAYCYINSH